MKCFAAPLSLTSHSKLTPRLPKLGAGGCVCLCVCLFVLFCVSLFVCMCVCVHVRVHVCVCGAWYKYSYSGSESSGWYSCPASSSVGPGGFCGSGSVSRHIDEVY